MIIERKRNEGGFVLTVTSLPIEELKQLKEQLQKEYEAYQAEALSLDMSRGKPSGTQLDCTNEMFDIKLDYMTKDGIDGRNYGILDGVPEVKELFGTLLDIPTEQMIVGGNSSLNMMYDTIARCFLFGTGGEIPWSKLPKVKFLCPCPGYDRHFAVTEEFGVEMIPIPMNDDGPDMDQVEQLVKEDEAKKGIW